MKILLLRMPAGRDEDDEFQKQLERAISRPPAGYFYSDMKFAMAPHSGQLWQEVIIIYSEMPTE